MPQRPDDVVVTVLRSALWPRTVKLEAAFEAPGMGLLAKVTFLGRGMICAVVNEAAARVRKIVVGSILMLLEMGECEMRRTLLGSGV